MMRTITSGVLAGLLLLAGCGGGASVPTAGRYTMDQNHFANALTDKLIEMGKAPAEFRAQLVGKLKSASFHLTLNEDGTFTGSQSILTERHSYKGTWELFGNSIRIDQTHEDGVEKEDSMTGTLADGKMTLTHREEGTELTVIMHHEQAAAAAPR